MPGILNQTLYTSNFGVLTTEDLRENLLSRNLPPPTNRTLVEGGLTSKLDDIGRVINVPIGGTQNENTVVSYNEEGNIITEGETFRDTQNVNNNRYIPQLDEYNEYGVNIPSEPYPDSGNKERMPYPTDSNIENFSLLSSGDDSYVSFPFNVIDKISTLTYENETSLGMIGAGSLETSVINKVAQIQNKMSSDLVKYSITYFQPPEDEANEFENRMRGESVGQQTLPIESVGWQEYNTRLKNNKLGNQTNNNQTNPVITTEQRNNTLISNTGINQTTFLFNALGLNVYVPNYSDRRLSSTSDAGTNSRYYIGSERSTNRGSKIMTTFTSDEFNGADGINSEQVGQTTVDENYYWEYKDNNNFNNKTILSETQQLVNNFPDDVFIDQTKKFFKDRVKGRLISRGNAISSESFESAIKNGKFCRVWTPTDTYKYQNAIRKSGLFSSDSKTKPGFSVTSDNASLSVLQSNGFVKTHPTEIDRTTSFKKYMLSIENLAWADNIADLTLDEIGPGDPLSRNKGRIMWFPPYDLGFDENMSANWTKTDFIGRGEPVYTYNNATRSGQLKFKVLVDHPKVINAYRGRRTNEIERFFAGCISPEEFLGLLDNSQGVSSNTKKEIEKKLNLQQQQSTTSNYSASEKYTLLFPKDVSSGVTIDSSSITNFLNVQKNSDKTVKIIINGYASKDETNAKTLATERSTDIKSQVESVVNSISNINSSTVIKSQVIDINGDSNSRRVDIKISYDAVNDSTAQHQKTNVDSNLVTLPLDSQIIDNLRIDETRYFDFIGEEYPEYFETISEKIKYFHPGFHSTTPEGLNTRLTFLQQCLRQGPSIYDKKDSNGIKPQNLAFGKPPVCILRIGDFINTKITINSLSITYATGNSPQWDLNPEGIGVQPMMADVTLSIDILGGQSLQGPISRLQNSLSFNYYANTEMYERRSDKLEIDAFIGARIVNGRSSLFNELLPGVANVAQKISLLGDSPKNSLKQGVPVNQSSQNNTPSEPAIPTDTVIININSNQQNVIIETLVNGILKPLDTPIRVIITDNKTNIVHIDEAYTSATNIISLSSNSTLAVAFSQSQEIVLKQNQITDLQLEYDSLPNTTAYNLNRKSQITNEIQTLNNQIIDLENQIMSVNVNVIYELVGAELNRSQTFTISDNKLI